MALCRITFALAVLCGIASEASAKGLSVGDLEYADCGGDASSQEYWYRRHPPYVGYEKGEPLSAGGDGTCVLGFAQGIKILVNGKRITLFKRKAGRGSELYVSKDGKIQAHVAVTGGDSTCVAGEEKCCGEYTYGTLTVSVGATKQAIKVVNYQGG